MKQGTRNSDSRIEYVLARAIKNIPRLDAEILLAHILKKNKTYLLSHPEEALSFRETVRFRGLVKKRKNGVPVAYLTGHKEFFGLDFFVNAHTLIPRPETERLVECALEKIEKQKKSRMQSLAIVDIGTGSGCIPIALLKHAQRTDMRTYATDISKGALRVARKNARTHAADITFLRGDLFAPILKTESIGRARCVFMTANLPYLTAAQCADEPSIRHEPRSALVAPDNGLALYKRLLRQVNSFILGFPHSRVSMFLEIDPSQSAPLSAYLRRQFPDADIQIKKDLAGHDRVVCADL